MPAAAKAPAKTASTHDARIDAQIAKAAPFAQPILIYLRDLVHEAVPDATEDLKWSRPAFLVNGKMICFMAAFKEHLGFGFWAPEMTAVLAADGIVSEGAGSMGKITTMKDLPPRKDLVRYVKQAAAMARSGEASSPMADRPRTRKPAIAMPEEFAAALRKAPAAATNFEAMPPSCKREYLEWITTAKRAETRDRRIVDAVRRIGENRRFNDQYR